MSGYEWVCRRVVDGKEVSNHTAILPFDKLAIAKMAEKCAIENTPEIFIGLGLHHAMHAGHADVALAPRPHNPGDGIQRRLQIEDADTDAEDIDTLRHLRFMIYDLRFQISCDA